MNIINNKTVSVYTSEELKDILENENTYTYIYIANNITLTSGININQNKSKITIDGTYLNTRYKLIGLNSNLEQDTINVINNTEVTVKNINIEYTNIYGVIYVPQTIEGIVVIYQNINFKGTQLSFNPYGTTKIIDALITLNTTNQIEAQEVCESNQVIIGGNTTITSTSIDYSLFSFRNTTNPSIIFLCKSNISLTTDTKDFMTGTNRLNLTILHDTYVNITAGNGFATKTVEGANNVLIEERATLILIENKHQRVPMWAIFGSFTIKANATLNVINSYDNTPVDNYNLYFKGTNQTLTIENPKEIILYNKNAKVIYTNNPVTFNIKCSRINLWNDSEVLSDAGTLTNLPDYSWYKNDDLLEITGTIDNIATTITNHNLTSQELTQLPDLTNFILQNQKQLSIGHIKTNIHAINEATSQISGHTTITADILIKYNGNENTVTTNDDGLFSLNLTDTIKDNTEIEFIINIPGTFIYETRKITTPYNGELTIMDIDSSLSFKLEPINNILPRTKELEIKVVNSKNSTHWQILFYISSPLTSYNGFTLDNAFIFKKNNNEIIVLSDTPQVIYEGTNNLVTTLTYSIEK